MFDCEVLNRRRLDPIFKNELKVNVKIIVTTTTKI